MQCFNEVFNSALEDALPIMDDTFDYIFGKDLRIAKPMKSGELNIKISEVLQELDIDFDNWVVVKTTTGIYNGIERTNKQEQKLNKALADRLKQLKKQTDNIPTDEIEKIEYLLKVVDLKQQTQNEFKDSLVVVYSRAPIDIIRMSDHGDANSGFRSCHEPPNKHNEDGGSYGNCAFDDSNNEGLIAYLVSNTAFQTIENLQADEIFEDDDRDIDGITPMSRIRIRYVVDDESRKQIIPSLKTYDLEIKSATTYKDAFVDSVEEWSKEYENPDFDWDSMDLMGGHYEDGGYDVKTMSATVFKKGKMSKTDQLQHIFANKPVVPDNSIADPLFTVTFDEGEEDIVVNIRSSSYRQFFPVGMIESIKEKHAFGKEDHIIKFNNNNSMTITETYYTPLDTILRYLGVTKEEFNETTVEFLSLSKTNISKMVTYIKSISIMLEDLDVKTTYGRYNERGGDGFRWAVDELLPFLTKTFGYDFSGSEKGFNTLAKLNNPTNFLNSIPILDIPHNSSKALEYLGFEMVKGETLKEFTARYADVFTYVNERLYKDFIKNFHIMTKDTDFEWNEPKMKEDFLNNVIFLSITSDDWLAGNDHPEGHYMIQSYNASFMGTGSKRGYVAETFYRFIDKEVGTFWEDSGEIVGYVANEGGIYLGQAIEKHIQVTFPDTYQEIIDELLN